jgi:hypothetical protein
MLNSPASYHHLRLICSGGKMTNRLSKRLSRDFTYNLAEGAKTFRIQQSSTSYSHLIFLCGGCGFSVTRLNVKRLASLRFSFESKLASEDKKTSRRLRLKKTVSVCSKIDSSNQRILPLADKQASIPLSYNTDKSQ